MENILTMNSVQKSFSSLDVLKDISMTVNRGEVVSIIGFSEYWFLHPWPFHLSDPPVTVFLLKGFSTADCQIPPYRYRSIFLLNFSSYALLCIPFSQVIFLQLVSGLFHLLFQIVGHPVR